MPPAPAAADRSPTPWSAALFLFKARAFQVRRALREARHGVARRLQISEEGGEGLCLAESRTLLYPSQVPAESALQAGKVQNLRVAAAFLNGVVIPGGRVFSFWAHVPRPTRRRGFAAGRELREGCIIPSIGGGLCQLSNALYDIALSAGCDIVERHAHSQRLPGSMAEAGRDATLFWNYVDLRFRPPSDCRLEIHLTRDELLVRLRALPAVDALRRHAPAPAIPVDAPSLPGPAVESCETCGVTACFRHTAQSGPVPGATAWLVDAWWPEFDLYLQQHRKAGDWLFLPLDSTRFHTGNYRWAARGFARVRQAPFQTLLRSWATRRLAAQGSERQRALLQFDRRLAEHYARRLPVTALHLVITQTLLPHLWCAGALGGRTFDVLMTRLPILFLQETLDRAAARHPRSHTLVDFRAPADVAAAEAAALAAARSWITPHSAIARLGGNRTVKLPWHVPSASSPGAATARRSVPSPIRPSPLPSVLFPASTLGRKGAYELAVAARELGVRVQLDGPVLELECWRGVETAPAAPGWTGAAVAALPAWIEHQPRVLLRALAAGLPVIAGEGCGLEDVPGVTTIPAGDVAALAQALRMHLEHSSRNGCLLPHGAE